MVARLVFTIVLCLTLASWVEAGAKKVGKNSRPETTAEKAFMCSCVRRLGKEWGASRSGSLGYRLNETPGAKQWFDEDCEGKPDLDLPKFNQLTEKANKQVEDLVKKKKKEGDFKTTPVKPGYHPIVRITIPLSEGELFNKCKHVMYDNREVIEDAYNKGSAQPGPATYTEDSESEDGYSSD